MEPTTVFLSDFPEPLINVLRATAHWAVSSQRVAYLVGGWLRDHLLGVKSWELDLVCLGDPADLGRALQSQLKGRLLLLHQEPAHYRFLGWIGAPKDAHVDLSEMVGSLTDDLARRDFTVNAMAVDIPLLVQKGVAPLFDPFGGIRDLGHRALRLTHQDVLLEDPIRNLRAFRFWATANLKPTGGTLEAIAKHSSLLSRTAPERVLFELSLIFQSETEIGLLMEMKRTGIFRAIVPELDALQEVPGIGYHHLNGLDHTLLAVAMVDLVRRGQTEDPDFNRLLLPCLPRFDEEGPGRRKWLWIVKMATLLHDVGKPATMTYDEQGRIHFYGHEKVGAQISQHICQRLRLSRKETDCLVRLVRHHMRPAQLAGRLPASRRALQRIWRELGEEDGLRLIVLSAADLMATRGPEMTQERRGRHYQILKALLEELAVLKELALRPRLITGYEVMERYGIRPGPLVGRALRLVEEAFLEGRIRDREEAFALLDQAMRQFGEPQEPDAL
ncbi:MAG: HD domain-containing protein [Armatimonadetes bacterium]|nr:HD domain-containing protein [Armatimonadota bacterium]MDW8121358.1 HD domain-containing protein [Armatimonadota bacterium]